MDKHVGIAEECVKASELTTRGGLYELRCDEVLSQNTVTDSLQRCGSGSRILRKGKASVILSQNIKQDMRYSDSGGIDVHRTMFRRMLLLNILELLPEIW